MPGPGPVHHRTDLRGIITYANENFVKISGYSRAELVGKGHNLVRHPDMPSAAFKDLWQTVLAAAPPPWQDRLREASPSGDRQPAEPDREAQGQELLVEGAATKGESDAVELALAALKHLIIDRDGIFERMLP